MRYRNQAHLLLTISVLGILAVIVEPPQTASASTTPCNPTVASISGSSNVWGKTKTISASGPGTEVSGANQIITTANWTPSAGLAAYSAAAVSSAGTSSSTAGGTLPGYDTSTAGGVLPTYNTNGQPPVYNTNAVRSDPVPPPTTTGGASPTPAPEITDPPFSLPSDTYVREIGNETSAIRYAEYQRQTGHLVHYRDSHGVIVVVDRNTNATGQGAGTQGNPTSFQNPGNASGIAANVSSALLTSAKPQQSTPTTTTKDGFKPLKEVLEQNILEAQRRQSEQYAAAQATRNLEVLNSFIETNRSQSPRQTVEHNQPSTPQPTAVPPSSSGLFNSFQNLFARPIQNLIDAPTDSNGNPIIPRPGSAPSAQRGALTSTSQVSPIQSLDGRVLGVGSASGFSSIETVTAQQGLDVTPEMTYRGNGLWQDEAGNRTQLQINAGRTPTASLNGCAGDLQGPTGGLAGGNTETTIVVSGAWRISGGTEFALRGVVPITVVPRPSAGASDGSAVGSAGSVNDLVVTNRCLDTGASVFDLSWKETAQATEYQIFMNGTGFNRVSNAQSRTPDGRFIATTAPANPGQTFTWQVWGIVNGREISKSNVATITAKSCAQPAPAPQVAAQAAAQYNYPGFVERPGQFGIESLSAQCVTVGEGEASFLGAVVTASWGSAANAASYVLTATEPSLGERTAVEKERSATVTYIAQSGASYTFEVGVSANVYAGRETAEKRSIRLENCTEGQGTHLAFPPFTQQTAAATPVVTPITPTPDDARQTTTAAAVTPFAFSATAVCVDRVPTATITWDEAANANSFAVLQLAPTATTYAELPAATRADSFRMLAPTGFEESYSVVGLGDGAATPGNRRGESTDVQTISVETPDCNPQPGSFEGNLSLTCVDGRVATKLLWTPAANADSYNIYDTSLPDSRRLLKTLSAATRTLDLAAPQPGRLDASFAIEAINGRGRSLIDVPVDAEQPDCNPVLPVAVTTTPPVAADDTATVIANTPQTLAVTANDTDLDGNLDATTVTIVEQPTQGIVTNLPNNQLQYTPRQDATGADTLTYRICDTTGQCDEATQAITIVPAPTGSSAAETPTTPTTPTPSTTSTPITLSLQAVCSGALPQNILTWNAQSDTATIYTIERDGQAKGTTTGTNFTDIDLTPGITHRYAITTSGVRSNEVVSQAQQCQPGAAPATPTSTPTAPTPSTTPVVPETAGTGGQSLLQTLLGGVRSFFGIEATPAPAPTPTAPSVPQTPATPTPALPTPAAIPTTPTAPSVTTPTPPIQTPTATPTPPIETQKQPTILEQFWNGLLSFFGFR